MFDTILQALGSGLFFNIAQLVCVLGLSVNAGNSNYWLKRRMRWGIALAIFTIFALIAYVSAFVMEFSK